MALEDHDNQFYSLHFKLKLKKNLLRILYF